MLHFPALFRLLLAAVWMISPLYAAEALPSPAAEVSGLDGFIERALTQSPRLKALGSGIAAARGEQMQAGVWSNPEAAYSEENIGGGTRYQAISPHQRSLSLTQPLEIGGKIISRQAIADSGLTLAELEYQAAALDLIREVTTAYADLIAAGEQSKLAAEQQQLAAEVLQSVNRRVGAAAAPLIQHSRAEVEGATALLEVERANRELARCQRRLALLTGEQQPVALPSAGGVGSEEFYRISPPEAADTSPQPLPDLARLDSRLEQAKARYALEKARAIPDPRLQLGVIQLPDADAQAMVVGVALPIPIFNANRGPIEQASREVERTDAENRQTRLETAAALIDATEAMDSAYRQAEELRETSLPAAEEAFRLAREGYGLGRFSYLDVLDAQRSLFRVRRQRVESLRDYHHARAKVERLNARHQSRIPPVGGDHAP